MLHISHCPALCADGMGLSRENAMSQPLRPFPVRRLAALLLHVLGACGVGALAPAALAQKNAPPPPIPLRDMPVADLSGGIIAWLDVPANTRETIQLTIPTEHHKVLTLVLEPISVLHESYESPLWNARDVVAGADGAEGLWREVLPRLGAGIEQVLVVVVGPIAQVVAAEVRPQPLDGVELG